jgi:hypothetical protein
LTFYKYSIIVVKLQKLPNKHQNNLMNSIQIKKIAAVMILALAIVPSMAFAVDGDAVLAGTPTGGDNANAATVDNGSALSGFTTGGDNANAGVAENSGGLESFTTGGDSSNAATVDNSGTLSSFTTGGNNSNAGTVSTSGSGSSGSGGNGGSSGTGGGSGGSGGSSGSSALAAATSGGSSSASSFTISPLYIVRLDATHFWVAFTTSIATEGQIMYGTRSNSDYDNVTSFDTSSITHDFTITLDPTITNYIRPAARIGSVVKYGAEVALAPNAATIADGGTFIPAAEAVGNANPTGSTTETGGDASSTASTTEINNEANTASVINSISGAIADFFKRIWNYLTSSMCVLPS